ncbi:MAG: DUF1211 domain-containing protein [Gammaproteobacteria bacterium]|nr:DUF1211 domain-containing protein [Gammaproteobacteria bacterium]
MKSYSYEKKLNTFPIRNNFKIRGENMTRVEVFTDAAFAFAITLLVFSQDGLPSSFDEFILLLKDIPAFATSFAQLAFFWFAHRVWSQRYGMEDLKTVFISCLLVFTVMVFVVPLKISYSTFLSFITNGYLPSPMEFNLETLQVLFIVFHIAFLSMCLIILWLYRHALSNQATLMLDEVELFETKSHKIAWIIMSITSATGLILTLILPLNLSPFGSMVYATLGISMSWNTIKRDKQKALLIKKLNQTTEHKGN